MARNYLINGECLVRVKLGDHVLETAPELDYDIIGSGPPILELGLSDGPIRVTPQWRHHDLHADDFGPHVPPEVLWMGGVVDIQMTLVHFDLGGLQLCLSEAQGGNQTDLFGNFNEGNLTPFGVPLGYGLPLYASGNHHIGLELSSPVQGLPWTFAACHLTGPPVIIPLGTERSLAQCTWRAIPYRGNVLSGSTLPPPDEVISGTVFKADRNYANGEDFMISGVTFMTEGTLLSGQLVTLSGFVPSFDMDLSSSGILLYDHLADIVP